MQRPRKWTEEELRSAVRSSSSMRQVLGKLGLKQAGGNYEQLKTHISKLGLSIGHMKGKAWSRGMIGIDRPKMPLSKILVKNSSYQTFKLKLRLFRERLKSPVCEECGWAKVDEVGRSPVELDHINGDNRDNRLGNLRILCPNCHSLKPTHRGKNQKRRKFIRPG